MSEHLHGFRRYLLIFAGMLSAGLLGSIAVHTMISSTGTLGPTILQCESPARAAAVVLACFAGAVVIAAVVARMTNAAVGLFVLGSNLWVISVRTGTVLDLAFSEVGSLRLVAVETAAWAVVLLAAAMVVFKAAGPLQDMRPHDEGEKDIWWNASGAISGMMGLLVLPGVMLIAQTSGKGQALMAVTIGAMASGMAGRLARPHVQPVLLFATPCLFGAIGHVIGNVMTGLPLDQAFVERRLSTLNVPMPADYAAGTLVGVSLGLGWARSFLHSESTDGAHASPGAPAARTAPVDSRIG